MTVNTTGITSGPYTGNNISTSFSCNFRVQTKNDLDVYETDLGGVQTLLTVDTDYTVNNIGEDSGGTITRIAGALPTGWQWYIRAAYDQTQDTEFTSQGAFFPELHENAMDKLTFLIQQLQDGLNRTLRYPISYAAGALGALLPIPEALKLIRWRSDLTGFENVDISAIDPDVVVLSDYVKKIDNVASLSNYVAVAGQIYELKEYGSGTGKGGGPLKGFVGVITPNGVTTFLGDAGTYFVRVNADRHVYEAGAVFDGTTDDTAALQRVLTAGLIAELPQASSVISSRLTYTINNSGFWCAGTATIKMTRAGFSQATYVTVINTTNCGIYANLIDRPVLKGVHIYLESGAGVRTAIAAAVNSCTNVEFDRTTGSGFTEPEFGVFTANSSFGSWTNGYVYDCTTSSNTLPSMQITGLMIDEDRVGGVYSQIDIGVWRFKNIKLTGAAFALYGFQTDGVTLAGGLTSNTSRGCTITAIHCEDVDEPIDIQSSNNWIGAVITKNCVYGAKMVHAARNNRIEFLSVDQSYSFGAVFSGSNSSSENARSNSIGRVVTRGIGALGGSLQKAAIGFDGGSAILKPNENHVESVSCYDNGAMDYVVYGEAGTGNTVKNIYTDTPPVISLFNEISPATVDCQFIGYSDQALDYVTGRYYGGECLNVTSTTTMALSADVLYGAPYVVSQSTRFGEISIYVAVASVGAGNARLGVYKMTHGAPGALIADIGTVDVSTVGAKAITYGLPLPAGVYALGIVCNAAISVYSSTANVVVANIVGVSNVGGSDVSMSRAFTYGALPASFGAVTYSTANIPNIILRTT